MPLTPDQLLDRLQSLGFETTTVRHPPLFTVADSQELRGEIEGGHTKNLFMKDKKGRLWLVVAEEDADIDLKRLHERIGSARLSFGKPELLIEVLGVRPGSVTPFGAVNDTEGRVTVVLDEALLRHAVLNFHPLTNDATTSIRRDDLIAFLRDTGHDPLVIAVSDPVT
ncbi:prolyl-tRNA synthetase associated domain-containing protein [Microbaculum marinum]|uniref:Prolyl-tRNA synthetase associated domain-containing protein n=1 Tax=Microbaculum marinum TaxID=1764581 RepID=A0AAW9RX92_9HYPH